MGQERIERVARQRVDGCNRVWEVRDVLWGVLEDERAEGDEREPFGVALAIFVADFCVAGPIQRRKLVSGLNVGSGLSGMKRRVLCVLYLKLVEPAIDAGKLVAHLVLEIGYNLHYLRNLRLWQIVEAEHFGGDGLEGFRHSGEVGEREWCWEMLRLRLGPWRIDGESRNIMDVVLWGGMRKNGGVSARVWVLMWSSAM